VTNITNNLKNLRLRVAGVARACGRDPKQLRLVAVSKKHPSGAIRQAYAAGQVDFGENFLQEALEKMPELSELPLVWHFIGRIQSNKTRPIAEHFDWVHTVDRLKIAQRLSQQRPPGAAPLNVCVQVNVGDPQNKAGVAPDDAAELARQVAGLPGLRLRGLMCMPPESEDPATQRGYFRILSHLREQLAAGGLELDTLSMGMSGDMESAILEGATLLRIGTAIFGSRNQDRAPIG